MTSFCRRAITSVLALTSLAGTALACGTGEPPPPPAPPVVCCTLVSWWIDPQDPRVQYIVVRYSRIDGLPLFQSNPMPVTPTQLCGCAFGKLPPIPGVAEAGLSFGVPFGGPCDPMPTDVPGYGPFGTRDECEPSSNQIDSFFDIFYNVAGIPRNPAGTSGGLSTVSGFAGPGTIPPGQVFDVYRKICFPRNVPLSEVTCAPGELTAIGLFLVNNGTALIEPTSPGQPPISFSQFQQNPGAGSLFKVVCCDPLITEPCNPCAAPPFCFGDANNSGSVNFADITAVLNNFNIICP